MRRVERERNWVSCKTKCQHANQYIRHYMLCIESEVVFVMENKYDGEKRERENLIESTSRNYEL